MQGSSGDSYFYFQYGKASSILLSPPLLPHHIFMFPPFTMAAIGHMITMQMCCEQGCGNIGEVEEVFWVEEVLNVNRCWRSGRGFRVGEVLKCGRGFTFKVNFPGGKNLCAQEWGGGEIIVHNAGMNQNPKPELVLQLPCCCSITFFTSTSNINYSVFFMLEDFLRPFLKTRSHDRSAHTFGSSHIFFKVPHKGILNK